MQCPQCQTKNREDAKFCKSCGVAMANQSNDQRCCANGHVLEDGWDTCPWCGSGVGTAPSDPTGHNPVRRQTVKEPIIREAPHSTLGPVPGGKMRNATELQTKPQRQNTVVLRSDSEPNAGKAKLVGFLVSYSRDTSGQAFEVREGRHVLGSGGNSTITISGDTTISTEHAVLLFRRGQFIIQDNLSTNGTFVDGEEIITQAILQHGSQIKLGETAFTLVSIG